MISEIIEIRKPRDLRLTQTLPKSKNTNKSRIIDMIDALVLPKLEEPDRLLPQAAKLTEILDVVVSDFYYDQRVSGEIAW